MNPLEIIHDTEHSRVILLEKSTGRYFDAKLNDRPKTHGFKNVNPSATILEKLNANDYSYYTNSIDLVATFMISNKSGTKVADHEMICPEIFPNTITELDANSSTTQLCDAIKSLMNEVRNLRYQLNESKQKIDELRNQIIEVKWNCSHGADNDGYHTDW